MPEHTPITAIPMERTGEQFDGTITEVFGLVFTQADQNSFEARLSEIDRVERAADRIGRTIFLRAF